MDTGWCDLSHGHSLLQDKSVLFKHSNASSVSRKRLRAYQMRVHLGDDPMLHEGRECGSHNAFAVMRTREDIYHSGQRQHAKRTNY